VEFRIWHSLCQLAARWVANVKSTPLVVRDLVPRVGIALINKPAAGAFRCLCRCCRHSLPTGSHPSLNPQAPSAGLPTPLTYRGVLVVGQPSCNWHSVLTGAKGVLN
jgi:hypothetical protein